MGPTEAEIDAVIFDMIAAEAARVPADTNLDDLWSSVAGDAYGQFQGYGFGYTPAEAQAGAWITAGGQSVTYGPFRVSCRKAGRSRPTRPVKGRCSRGRARTKPIANTTSVPRLHGNSEAAQPLVLIPRVGYPSTTWRSLRTAR